MKKSFENETRDQLQHLSVDCSGCLGVHYYHFNDTENKTSEVSDTRPESSEDFKEVPQKNPRKKKKKKARKKFSDSTRFYVKAFKWL